jgi:hypothetical protein
LETDESNKHCQSQGYAGCTSQVLEHLLASPASNLTAGSGTRISHTGIFITRKNTGFQLFLGIYFGESSSCIYDG